MTAELTNHDPATVRAAWLPPEPPEVQRTAEEKASILARLTVQMAALDHAGGRNDGNA